MGKARAPGGEATDAAWLPELDGEFDTRYMSQRVIHQDWHLPFADVEGTREYAVAEAARKRLDPLGLDLLTEADGVTLALLALRHDRHKEYIFFENVLRALAVACALEFFAFAAFRAYEARYELDLLPPEFDEAVMRVQRGVGAVGSLVVLVLLARWRGRVGRERTRAEHLEDHGLEVDEQDPFDPYVEDGKFIRHFGYVEWGGGWGGGGLGRPPTTAALFSQPHRSLHSPRRRRCHHYPFVITIVIVVVCCSPSPHNTAGTSTTDRRPSRRRSGAWWGPCGG